MGIADADRQIGKIDLIEETVKIDSDETKHISEDKL